MNVLSLRYYGPLLLCVSVLHFVIPSSQAQPFVPLDVGTTVAGYQDDFTGSALAAGWQIRGANVYAVTNGLLHVASASGDPNHLLYAVAGYNNSVQEVLARMRVLNFGSGESRAGLATVVDPAAAIPGGIDFHFRDENLGRHVEFLDDTRAWGTEYQFTWQNNVWYWVRLRHEPNAAGQGGVNDAFGKIWLGDGSQTEPAAWQDLHNYTPAVSARTGFAGIAAGSAGTVSEFEVDYILIKASGLPNIVAAPIAFPLTQTPATITNQPQSQTVDELQPATFSVGISGNPTPTLQWFRNDVAISGATNTSYRLAAASLNDHNVSFKVTVANVASNVTYSRTSDPATLRVNADHTAPTLLLAQASGFYQLQVVFSERVNAATATNASNYVLTGGGGVVVSNVFLDATQTNVTLNVGKLSEGITYTLAVHGVTDQAAAANPIAAGAQASFQALSYTATDIGSPTLAGGSTAVPGGFNVTGGGTDIGGTSDQFQFDYEQRSGDFDLKVRIEALGFSDAWAEAGLMARESLAAGSRFASVMATPTSSGSYFQSRAALNGATTLRGSFPVNYPNTWLRLQRVGSQFTGYASVDGQSWNLLGTTSLAVPANLYFGFAVSSHKTNQTTVAAFRDLGAVVNPGTNIFPLPVEALGQSDRKTGLIISEIMYHPAATRGSANTNLQGYITNSLEFVELFNSLGTPEDLSGFRLSGDIEFTFPPGTVIPGSSFLVVAKSVADLQRFAGSAPVLGPYAGELSNSSGTVRLRNRIGAIYLEVNYDSKPPWPVAADGGGHSLILGRPSRGEEDWRAWAASDAVGGSPGRPDPVPLDPLRNVRLNEFLAHTDSPDLDFIELYNHSEQSLDISGCTLSDEAGTNKFILSNPTILPPRSFRSWNQNQLGFSLSADGETIWFRNAAGTRVLDAVHYEAQANGISSGRYPDGAATWRALSTRTPGMSNTTYLANSVVINEIMYHPISGNDDDQFVELYNNTSTAINLAGWKFSDGINFTFPSNAVLASHGYGVVSRNATRLAANYPSLSPNLVWGNFDGTLSGGGERLALARPELSISTNNSGAFVTNTIEVVVNEVTYGDGGRWGQWSDGGGSSLELVDPRSDNNLAASWADSDETGKAGWGTFSVTGLLDLGDVPADQLQVLLLGVGECLVDDVEVLNSGGANQIANGTFETDATGWTAEGTEQTSGLETTGGYNSTKSYHVRAVERGDNQVNRIRTPLIAALSGGSMGTIRAKIRWLRGHPEVLLRLRGKWLELFCPLVLPANLGTPGARNSRALSNSPPALAEVIHSPILPAANQPCVVTARASDPDGPLSMVLRYRLDPATEYASAVMNDNGTGGDALARDGIFSATIPGQVAGAMVAFYVQATDGLSASATFPNDAPLRECLVRFGEVEPAGNFPVYRVWMTQATLNTWTSRSKLNNTPLDVTFVLGGQRVIYNASALYAGSPYIAPGYTGPTAGRCGYTLSFPSDDLFLGSSGLVLDWPGGHGNESTALQEQMGYWIADKMDLAFSHRYYIRLHVNGVTDDQRGTIFEAVIQPGREFLDAWLPDQRQGDFYKIDRAFEFNDAGGLSADPMPRLDNYITTGGAKKTARYRGSWLKRAGESYANFTNLFQLVDAANAAPADLYTAQMENTVDIDQWMRIQGVEHIIVNFDSWGHEIGKNMYAYKPDNGKWQLYMFDLDWLMLAAPGRISGYAANMASMFTCEDPNITKMFNHPPFRRAYFRAMQDAVDGPLVSANCNPVMDAKYASLLANGALFCDGQNLGPPTAVKQWFADRRGYLVAQLAGVAAPFAINGSNNFAVSSNLLVLTGTAPVSVKTIEVDGVAWPVTWTSVNNWILRLPLSAPTNVLNVVGYDLRGHLVAGTSNQLTVVYAGPNVAATGAVVINEILSHPTLPGAEFVELFNTATNFAFDLTGWRINGLDYTFPEGSFIAPRGYLVLGHDRTAGAALLGPSFVPFDIFTGNLQTNGETLTLLRPTDGGPMAVVDQVRYENSTPWPHGTNGYSAQLIDAAQDNARVSNWADGSGWRFYSFTGPTTSSRLIIFLDGVIGDVYLDDISLVAGSVPNMGANLVRNGDFEGPLTTNVGGPWTFVGAISNSVIDPNVKHSGNGSLHLISEAPGSAGVNIFQDTLPIVSGGTYTLSYWYLPLPNEVRLTTRMSAGFRPSNSLRATPATPGAANSGVNNLPAYPSLWINELQPANLGAVLDHLGEAEPWIELYNSGSNSISLNGYFLSTNYDEVHQWPFPNTASIAPGQFLLVFADGQPGQSTVNELHTNFRLPPGGGSVVLSRLLDGAPQILDYINYEAVTPGASYGSFPDGQPFNRQEFYYVTSRAANNAARPPIVVFINEWMAGNTGTLSDPANPGEFDDWFELYNPGTSAVSLDGYFLSDALTNKFQFQIPSGYSIPAGGFLLVWADNQPNQNNSNRLDLHANFALNRAGEALGLFGPDGSTVDAVTFGNQTNDVSQGRFSDGGTTIGFLSQPTPRASNVGSGDNRPGFSRVRLVGTAMTIDWVSLPGRTYRVEATDDLGAPNWQPLGSDLPAGSSSLSLTVNVTAASHRFFRLLLLP